MPLIRFPKTFEQTYKIKTEKSLKRVDSDCILLDLPTKVKSFVMCFFQIPPIFEKKFRFSTF